MTHTARHAYRPAADRVLSALKLVAATLAIVAVGMAYTVLSVATAATVPTVPGPGHHDTRCALTAYTDAQCAAGFADNGVNGDN